MQIRMDDDRIHGKWPAAASGPIAAAPAETWRRVQHALARGLSDLVNSAYGLTPDEVALMWETAPPRMPIGRPRFGANT